VMLYETLGMLFISLCLYH